MRAQAEGLIQVLRFGDVEVRESEFSVTKAGVRLSLEPKTFKVLLYLLHHPGRLVSKDELLNTVWGDAAVTENSLTRTVALLRHVLGDDPHKPRYIETVNTMGYRFVCPVKAEEPAQHRADVDVDSAGGIVSTIRVTSHDAGARAALGQRPGAPSAYRVFSKWMAWLASGVLASLAIFLWVKVAGQRERVPEQGDSRTALALQIQPVTNAPGLAMFPVFSPDGRQAAFLWAGPESKRLDLYVQLLGSDTPLRLTHNMDGMLGPPAWSPDGREIAYSLCRGKKDAVYVVPALGGAERELTHVGCPYTDPPPIAWLSNGQEMLTIDHCPDAGSFDLVVFSLASGKKRCVTHSVPMSDFDNVISFSLSPDGETVAFAAGSFSPCFADVYTIPLAGGSPRQLTNQRSCLIESMWTPDGKSIVLGPYKALIPPLWRISASGGPLVREMGYPAIGSFSQDGRRFVYASPTYSEGPAIWRADLASEAGPVLKNREYIRTQFQEMGPQVSPDGTRIAWRSDRTGYGQIWTSGTNGEGQLQLTHLDWYSSTPRWSPDGKWVSFTGVRDGKRQIFIIDSEGRGLRQITDGSYENIESSWSQDGQSIYFASMRTGSWQVWKRTLASGAGVQVTKQGGFDSFESYDGRNLYFSKFYESGIWSVPASGGTESLVIEGKPQVAYWGYWGGTRDGLYFLNVEAEPQPRVEFYSFTTRRTTPVLAIAKRPHPLQAALSATPDGRTIYYTVYDRQSVIKMMEVSP